MWNIAINTFKEIVRNKFLYLILIFAFIFIIFSISLGKLTIWNDEKIIVDFGLAMIEIFGLVWVLFTGSQLLFKEIEWKTIFLILSKPIKRHEFILWKFLWFSGTILLIILLQSILFLIVLAAKGIPITHLIVFSLLFTYFKLEIVLALVFFLSTFMGNMLTIIIALMVYFLSHSYSILLDMAVRAQNIAVEFLVKGIQLLFPPFEALNIKDSIGSFSNFGVSFFALNTIYALIYLSLLLIWAVYIFNKKRFEN